MRWKQPSSLFRSPGEGQGPTAVLDVGPDGDVALEPSPGAEPRDGDILIGLYGGTVWYARPVASTPPAVTNFRATPNELIATASALVRWHASSPRCEQCHAPTVMEARGQRRRCTACGALLFYRTDPAVIVAITDDDDRLLLARQRAWPQGRMSVIAGFVEPGESLEQACAREAMEEVGLALTRIDYFGSQPWPFPRSLMLGFTAIATDPGALVVDGEEIVEASFLTREELASRLGAGRISLPGPASIGRALIDAWRG